MTDHRLIACGMESGATEEPAAKQYQFPEVDDPAGRWPTGSPAAAVALLATAGAAKRSRCEAESSS